jgi:hypothetical protein
MDGTTIVSTKQFNDITPGTQLEAAAFIDR